MWDLVPWPGIEPGSLASGVQNFSHWTTREVLVWAFERVTPFLRRSSFNFWTTLGVRKVFLIFNLTLVIRVIWVHPELICYLLPPFQYSSSFLGFFLTFKCRTLNLLSLQWFLELDLTHHRCCLNLLDMILSSVSSSAIVFLINLIREVPGGLMVRISGFHCHCLGLVPGWGSEIPQSLWWGQKANKQKTWSAYY